MSEFLTKEQILKGKKHTESVELSIGVVKIRALTIGEKATARSMLIRGMRTSGKTSSMIDPHIEGDANVLMENLSDYHFYIIACALSVEGKEIWSAKEVRQMSIEQADFSKLVGEVERVSGLEKGGRHLASVKKFPPESGGPEPEGSDSDL